MTVVRHPHSGPSSSMASPGSSLDAAGRPPSLALPLASATGGESARVRLAGLAARALPSRRWFALLFAVWGVDAVLRILQLARPAPLGNPFVEKLDWYLFHALAFDARYGLLPLLPLLVLEVALHRGGARNARAVTLAYWLTLALQVPVQILVGLDLEVMRYMGVHASPSFLLTYCNPTAVSDLGVLTGNDRGGPYLPMVLAFGSPLVAIGAALGLARWLARWRASRKWMALGSVAYLVSGLVLTTAWGGTFRERKLSPVLAVWFQDRFAPPEQLAAGRYQVARDHYRRLWQAGALRPWVFPEDDLPLWRATLEEACHRGWTHDPRCGEDGDGDGVIAKDDCDDGNAEIFPGAADQPSNGVDEDCDGMDTQPWNVVLIILESHRALEVGHLRPFGATGDSTPVLDRLAAGGTFWTRHTTNGIPTIAAFMNLHCSIHESPTHHVATTYTSTALDCLPSVLRRHGYETRFFTASAPDWDNQTYWLVQWYQHYDFDRSRQTDLSMFRHMGEWMVKHLTNDRPFFIGAITKTNHYPFNAVDDMTPEEQAGTPDHIDVTQRYADRALGEFLRIIEPAPWRRRTLIVVTGDHGVSLGEHGLYGVRAPLYRSTAWVPLVMDGAHPRLPRGAQRAVSSHVDVMPTVLDLLGIHDPTGAMGQSLVRPSAGHFSFGVAGDDFVLERGAQRAIFSGDDSSQARLFDVERDPGELTPLEDRALLTTWLDEAQVVRDITVHALAANRVVPEASGGD